MSKQQAVLEEVSLSTIVSILFNHKKLILSVVSLFAVVSVVFALSLPNRYISTVKLISNKNSQTNLSSLAGGLGGLAGLAGISLGGSGDEKGQLAKELLQSRTFLYDFTHKHNILIPLIAAEGVDSQNELVINNKLYDQNTKQWVRDVVYPKPVIPSAEDIYFAFEDILMIDSDKKTGVVKISLEFYSPEIVQQWLTWLVEDVNEAVRQQDMLEAKSSIEYLNNIASKSESAAMKDAFFQLMEEQMKTLLLTEVRQEYVFKTLDPASFPEEKSSPKRALICVGITLGSAILVIMFVLIRHFSSQSN